MSRTKKTHCFQPVQYHLTLRSHPGNPKIAPHLLDPEFVEQSRGDGRKGEELLEWHIDKDAFY